MEYLLKRIEQLENQYCLQKQNVEEETYRYEIEIVNENFEWEFICQTNHKYSFNVPEHNLYHFEIQVNNLLNNYEKELKKNLYFKYLDKDRKKVFKRFVVFDKDCISEIQHILKSTDVITTRVEYFRVKENEIEELGDTKLLFITKKSFAEKLKQIKEHKDVKDVHVHEDGNGYRNIKIYI